MARAGHRVLFLCFNTVLAKPPHSTLGAVTQTLTEATLQAHLEQNLLVGGAVGVYRNGELWQDLCVGSVDPGGPPVTTDTPFILFSNSKPLAA